MEKSNSCSKPPSSDRLVPPFFEISGDSFWALLAMNSWMISSAAIRKKKTIEKQLDVVGFLFREKRSMHVAMLKNICLYLYIYSNSNGFPQRILPNRSLNLNKLEH